MMWLSVCRKDIFLSPLPLTLTVDRTLTSQMGAEATVVADPAMTPANIDSAVLRAPPAAILEAASEALEAACLFLSEMMTSRVVSKKP